MSEKNCLPNDLEEAVDLLDAALFTGDIAHRDKGARNHLKKTMESWLRELKRIEEMEALEESENKG